MFVLEQIEVDLLAWQTEILSQMAGVNDTNIP